MVVTSIHMKEELEDPLQSHKFKFLLTLRGVRGQDKRQLSSYEKGDHYSRRIVPVVIFTIHIGTCIKPTSRYPISKLKPASGNIPQKRIGYANINTADLYLLDLST